ncbi:MAG: zinc-dependent metalloprotease, partial [Parashewanella sp.]
AGFIDGFQVKLLPESADPQDIRYNMIQWVHRATRGWSYGSVISDPRTGEIIKGHVTLGSLRVRQDLLIARGLTSGWKDRKAAHEASMKMALARIRQLAAHEVGHTLGLAHNFAASTFNDSSVMDYPHPKIGMKNGEIDIAHAYGVGVGAWDNFAIQYGYGDFGNKQNTQIALAELVKQAQKQGLRNISEADSRAANSGHVYASLWDNGKDAVDELNRLQSIRELVIKGFGKQALLPDQFQGSLSDAFVPMYLLSRYQINAAAKYLGGTQYSYYQSPISSPAKQWHFVSANKQRAALKALLKTIESDELLVPKKLVSQLVPKAGVLTNTRESFPSSLGVIVDPLAMAEVLSRHTLNNILQPKRLDRINQAYWMDEEQLSVAELIDDVMHASFLGQAVEKAQTAIWMRVNAVAVDSLLASLHSKNTTTEVKAILASKLEFAIGRLKHKAKRAGSAQAAHFNWLATSIEKGIDDKQFRLIEKPLPMPPGSPI